MSERIPTGDSNNSERISKEEEENVELQEQNAENQVRSIFSKIVKSGIRGAPYTELLAFQKSFLKHFGEEEARRYRLFHISIGSTSPDSANHFDAAGEWSVLKNMENIAKKYNLSPSEE